MAPAWALGLFIAQQIIRAHRGTIAVSSSAEAGTIVAIKLPLQRSPTVACQTSPPMRLATLATVAASSAGSTGLDTCTRNPARNARVRSSERANAVRAIAGTRPPRAGPSARIRRSRANPIDSWHPDIGDQDIRPLRLQQHERIIGVAGGDRLRAAVLEHARDQIARIGLILHDQNLEPGELSRDRLCRALRRRRRMLAPRAVLAPVHDEQRKLHGDRRAEPLAGASGANGPAV